MKTKKVHVKQTMLSFTPNLYWLSCLSLVSEKNLYLKLETNYFIESLSILNFAFLREPTSGTASAARAWMVKAAKHKKPARFKRTHSHCIIYYLSTENWRMFFSILLLLLSIVFEQTPSRYIPVQRPSVLCGEAQSGGSSTRLPRTVYREILAIRDTLVHFDCSLSSAQLLLASPVVTAPALWF